MSNSPMPISAVTSQASAPALAPLPSPSAATPALKSAVLSSTPWQMAAGIKPPVLAKVQPAASAPAAAKADATKSATPVPIPAVVQPAEPPLAETPLVEARPARTARAGDFAEVQRRRAELNRKEALLRTQQIQLDADRKAMADDTVLAKSNPLKFMRKHGVSYDQIIDRIAAGETAVHGTEAEKTQIEKDVEALKQAQADRSAAEQRAREQAVIGQFKSRLGEHLKSQVERYDVIVPASQFLNVPPEDLVFAVIQENYRQTESAPGAGDGSLLTFDQACDLVQGYYENQAGHLMRVPRLHAKIPQPTEGDEAGASPAAADSLVDSENADSTGGARDDGAMRPNRLTNALTAAPAIAASGVTRRARGAMAIDEAIDKLVSGRE
jgi:hypothetical protein